MYLFKPTPIPKNAALFFSETDAYIGSKPASTSAESIFELQKTLSNKLGLFVFVLFNNSEMKVSKT